MVDRGELFLEDNLEEENSRREIDKTKERLIHIERENKELNGKLKSLEKNKMSRVIKTLSLFALAGSFFMFSSNMTGYFISEEINTTKNFASIILFGLGIFGLYISKKI